MAVTGVNTSVPTYDPKAARAAQATAQQTGQAGTAEKAADSKAEKKEDGFDSDGTTSVTYKKPTKISANDLMAMEQQRTSAFTQMLRSMVAKQGEKSNLNLFGLDLNVTPQDSAKAASAIGEGGDYSVDAVAGRIMDMAKALAGGDPSKIDLLRGAVEKGFKAAGVDLGGKLPSICNDTHTEVMKRFDEWQKEFDEGKSTVEPGAKD